MLAAILFTTANVLATVRPAKAVRLAPIPGWAVKSEVAGGLATAPAPPAFRGDWIGAHPAPDLGLHAQSAILVDPDMGQVLWGYDAYSRRAPASLTKMMTVLVALDHVSLDHLLTVSPDAAQTSPDWTVMGVSAGEQLTVRELLYGIFLVSGNDAADTLATAIEPPDQFVAEMNAKAAALGLHDTHFTNPTGLDDDGLYSTAYDLAVIAAELWDRYPEVMAIAGTSSIDLPANGLHKDFNLLTLNKLMLWGYPGANGLKTGFTWNAGGCVAGTAQRASKRLISVVLNSDIFFTDSTLLLDYGFASS
jgi:D-alanyl-D-alanine carboxypeptidase (penicillin-binding protein 5/6)